MGMAATVQSSPPLMVISLSQTAMHLEILSGCVYFSFRYASNLFIEFCNHDNLLVNEFQGIRERDHEEGYPGEFLQEKSHFPDL